MKKLLMFALLAAPLGANAVVVDINAMTTGGGPNSIDNPVTISGLSPTDVLGITHIGVADGGAYNAWNPWGFVAGCDDMGSNCSNGWVTFWRFFVNGDSGTTYGAGSGVRYATDLLALANALPVPPISGITSISFYVGDSFYSDNLGGISLNVVIRPVTDVPEPAALALLGLGLAGLGVARRRRR